MKHNLKSLLSNTNPNGGCYSELNDEQIDGILRRDVSMIDFNEISSRAAFQGRTNEDYLRNHWQTIESPLRTELQFLQMENIEKYFKKYE